jgi:hypothetical protein
MDNVTECGSTLHTVLLVTVNWAKSVHRNPKTEAITLENGTDAGSFTAAAAFLQSVLPTTMLEAFPPSSSFAGLCAAPFIIRWRVLIASFAISVFFLLSQ